MGFLDKFTHDALTHFLRGAATKLPNDPTYIRALQATPHEGLGVACIFSKSEDDRCPQNPDLPFCCYSSPLGSAACSASSTCDGGEDASSLYAGGCSRGPCI